MIKLGGSVFGRLLAKLALIAPGGYTLRPMLHRLRGVQIGKNAWISQFVYIDEAHPNNVIIRDNVTIGIRCTIFAHFYSGHYSLGKKVGKVVIEDNVYIGPHCVIFHDVVIGEGSVIAAGSVVTKSVPAGVLYGPPPSRSLARVTRPLVKGRDMNYERFMLGLRKL
jgi:acetyltransferase-like isoleucine patch superfamily enzyme